MTARYVPDFAGIQRARVDERWWADTLAIFAPSSPSSTAPRAAATTITSSATTTSSSSSSSLASTLASSALLPSAAAAATAAMASSSSTAGASGGGKKRARDESRGGSSSTPIDLDDDGGGDGGGGGGGGGGVGIVGGGGGGGGAKLAKHPLDSAAEAARAAEAAEDAELAEWSQKLPPLPTSLAAYKKHPQLVLERDIGRFEAIHPPETPALAFVKGQRVFARKFVHKLMTAEKWYREPPPLGPRVLRPGAEEAPAKRLKKAASAAKAQRASAAAAEGEISADAAERAAEASEVLLYGRWQTIAYVPPTAQDGVVPRSQYGHVELWSEAHLPYGTVVLREAGVAQVARQLGVDCAPAMVGFDIRDGRSVPRFDGVVVCVEAAAMLREAAAAWRERQEDGEARKRRAQVEAMWKRTLLALGVRCRLQQEYGGGGGGSGSGSGGGVGGGGAGAAGAGSGAGGGASGDGEGELI